jgi:hypothetical protein
LAGRDGSRDVAYFFHVERDGQRIVDQEGSAHDDLHAAEVIAVKTAAEMAAEDLKRGAKRLEQFIVVENEFGQEVVRVRVSAVLEVQASN